MFERRVLVRWFALVAAIATTSVCVPGAAAAQRLETIDLPSAQGNVDPTTALMNNGTRSLKANVLLPDGYDEHPDRQYPLLYLLHGGADDYSAWAKSTNGNIQRVAAGFPGIIVMPEGGRGSFIDWYSRGERRGPRWARYYLDEVIPTIHARYRVRSGRQHHAIGGLSMGAYGALFLGGQLPGYFGTILSLSAVLDTQAPLNVAVSSLAIAQPFENVIGSLNGSYARAHNPLWMIANVASSRVYLYSGNGVPDLRFPWVPEAWTAGAIAEANIVVGTLRYAQLAPSYGAHPTVRIRGGVHGWPYWRRELPLAFAWNLFGEPPVASEGEAPRWRYRTMELAGNAWGLGYRFAEPPTEIITLSRDGQQLTGLGSGIVTITPGAPETDATGAGSRSDCAFTATLPFRRVLPAGC